MDLLEINIQSRVIIGISAMVVLFTGFLVVFITNQRKKLQYHKELQAIQLEQQESLKKQNLQLEQRVEDRTAEISEQKEMLQVTLEELRSSQLHLVQKEKMASLGELTAGIAHEIQNPLNFVLNFGEINKELVTEIKQGLEGESLSDRFKQDISPLMDDLADNLSKILQHGKRADGIVRNMLQHTRKETGVMVLTDLNELTDEFLKMSYHGFRARHKSFNCTFNTIFEGQLEPIRIIPQDIGHILVNIFGNAFYSMQEKKKTNASYEPVLSIHTSRKDGKAIIEVRDNGMGIPDKIINKIFQPFFTTKPTGEATGLGLSLSYDMIRAHKGDIKVNSVEGEYAQFEIELNY